MVEDTRNINSYGGDKFLTQGQVELRLGVSEAQMRRYKETGYLNLVKGPRTVGPGPRKYARWIFPIEEIIAYEERVQLFRATWYSRARVASRLGVKLGYLRYCYSMPEKKIFGIPAPIESKLQGSKHNFTHIDELEKFERLLADSLEEV